MQKSEESPIVLPTAEATPNTLKTILNYTKNGQKL